MDRETLFKKLIFNLSNFHIDLKLFKSNPACNLFKQF